MINFSQILIFINICSAAKIVTKNDNRVEFSLPTYYGDAMFSLRTEFMRGNNVCSIY